MGSPKLWSYACAKHLPEVYVESSGDTCWKGIKAIRILFKDLQADLWLGAHTLRNFSMRECKRFRFGHGAFSVVDEEGLE